MRHQEGVANISRISDALNKDSATFTATHGQGTANTRATVLRRRAWPLSARSTFLSRVHTTHHISHLSSQQRTKAALLVRSCRRFGADAAAFAADARSSAEGSATPYAVRLHLLIPFVRMTFSAS